MKHVKAYEKFEIESLSPEIEIVARMIAEDAIYDGPDDKPRFDIINSEQLEEFLEVRSGWFETPFASVGGKKSIVLGVHYEKVEVVWRVYDLTHKKQVDIPFEDKERAIETYNYIGSQQWVLDNRGRTGGNKFGF